MHVIKIKIRASLRKVPVVIGFRAEDEKPIGETRQFDVFIIIFGFKNQNEILNSRFLLFWKMKSYYSIIPSSILVYTFFLFIL